MGQLLKNILHGAKQVLVLWPDSDYVHPQRRAFAADAMALRKDAAQVTEELRNKVEVHGKQINYG